MFIVELDQQNIIGDSARSEAGDGFKSKVYLFTHKYTTYVYNEQTNQFVELKYDIKKPLKEIKQRGQGIKEKDRDNLVS
jgi:hypothetical protein